MSFSRHGGRTEEQNQAPGVGAHVSSAMNRNHHHHHHVIGAATSESSRIHDESNHSQTNASMKPHCGDAAAEIEKHIRLGEWPVKAHRISALEVEHQKHSCINGLAASEYSCKNVDLLSFVPLDDFDSLEANDVWGWTDKTTGKEYALIGLYDGTCFVDISVPTMPVVIGKMKGTSSSTMTDIKVYKDYAFVVADMAGHHGVQIFNLTRLRAGGKNLVFEPDAVFMEVGSAHNLVINEASSTLFVVGDFMLCNAGLYMVDISTPLSPKAWGCGYDAGYTHDAQCVNYSGPDTRYHGREICVLYAVHTVAIVDVTNKTNPAKISQHDLLGLQAAKSYIHQGWLDEQQAYAYMDDEFGELLTDDKRTKTHIFNLTDLQNPQKLNPHISNQTAVDHNQYTLDGHIYQANYCAGLRVLKISQEPGASPSLTEVAHFDVSPDCDRARFAGAWSVYPYLKSGSLLVSGMERGLFVVKGGWRPFVCAKHEGHKCSCTGTVFYGRKFVSGRPGNGTKTSLKELKETPYAQKFVNQSIGCHNGEFGDPFWGYYKYCYCVPQ